MVEEGQGKGKGRVPPFEPEDLEGLQAELLRFWSSVGAQRASRGRAEGKLRWWEAKVEELVGAGDQEREEWAQGNLEKARTNSHEKKGNVEPLERAVQRLEDLVGQVGR